MNWVIVVIIAIVVELVIRFFTREMEDKKKRERILSSLWLVLAVGLIIYWIVDK